MTSNSASMLPSEAAERRSIKCIVWDLDHTIWHGILLEDQVVSLRPQIAEVIKELDRRGILQSIASRNDADLAMGKLEQFGLKEYFLYPQINWNSKPASIRSIAANLNLSLDSFAFVDDQPFEREAVAFEIPEVLCIDAAEISAMLQMPELQPRFITDESSQRRLLYLSDIERSKAEQEVVGSNEDFLATLGMVFTIAEAKEEDLQRAEELTVRTHQLNSTGYTYSYEELQAFLHSSRHKLLVASLDDKFGPYGKIGLALIECDENYWTLKLLLMSCRVISRGVGTILLNHIMDLARQANVTLRAEFVPTDRNRMMYIAYKFAGFSERDRRDNLVILENDLSRIQPFPDYITVRCPA